MWIIAIIVTILIVFVGKIIINIQKDKEDLLGKSVEEKFNVIVNSINQFAFNGEGEIKYIGKNHFNLYPDSSNQIVDFMYSQGMLSIIWKYKYLQKEMVYTRNLTNVRNLSLLEQTKIAHAIIGEMNQKIQEHKNSVWAMENG